VGKVIQLVALALLALPASMAAQPRPAFATQPGRVVTVALPASILSDREVHRQLGSGLTTTFVLEARQRDGARRGAARIEIRFDLWDEVWVARRIELDGKEERQRLPTRAALEKWWSTPFRIFAATADRAALQMTLTVLPFSVAEGDDAREWISKAGGSAVREGGSPLITAMIGTTVSAKPIRTYRWSVDVVFR
jgi:hypothetical protein